MRRFALLSLIAVACASAVGAVDVGDDAPPFVIPGIDGAYVFSRNLFGRGWLLLDFFATDCEPCLRELPELEAVYAEFAEQGLAGIVFATDSKGAAVVKPFFESRPTPLTILIDRFRVVAEAYRVREIPTVLLVDPDGRIAFRHEGYSPEAIAEIRAILADRLREPERQ